MFFKIKILKWFYEIDAIYGIVWRAMKRTFLFNFELTTNFFLFADNELFS